MSDQAPYDPNAPEGDTASGRGQYMTVRDLRVIGIALVVLGFLLFPVYGYLKGNSEKARCTQNLKAISEALNLYANEHDSRYPPIARTEEIGGVVPSLGKNGYVYTWASDISGYMSQRASFRCPTATEAENVLTEDIKGGDRAIPMSYGMYAPYGGYLTSLVEFPDQAIIVGETSNRGALDTFDPHPFVGSDGTPRPDGFVIGWSNGNDFSGKPDAVTRLAFPNSADGKFLPTGASRHGRGIHLLTASGERILATPDSAIYRNPRTLLPSPLWAVPAGTQRGR